jgi:hypothetical protein
MTSMAAMMGALSLVSLTGDSEAGKKSFRLQRGAFWAGHILVFFADFANFLKLRLADEAAIFKNRHLTSIIPHYSKHVAMTPGSWFKSN